MGNSASANLVEADGVRGAQDGGGGGGECCLE